MIPATRTPRLAGVEGVRGLAALAVLVYHVWLYSPTGFAHALALPPLDAVVGHLWLGVTVFFVLSGFLLYRPFAAASLRAARSPSVVRYTWSRVLRIVPAYWLALTVLAVAFHRPLLDGDLWAVAKNYLFLQLYLPDETIIGPAWTLCVEATYYATLPLLAWAIARCAAGSATRHLLALVPLVLVGVGYEVLRIRVAPSLPPALPGYLDEFAVGMGLAVVFESRTSLGRPGRLATAAALLALAATPLAHERVLASPDEGLRVLLYEPVMALAFALALAALVAGGASGRAARILTLPSLAGLGAVSYGVYLWHEPLVHELTERGLLLAGGPAAFAANVAIVAAVALAAATASWRGLERPVLALKDRRRPRVSSPAPALPIEPA